jgi:hypothetical protein
LVALLLVLVILSVHIMVVNKYYYSLSYIFTYHLFLL